MAKAGQVSRVRRQAEENTTAGRLITAAIESLLHEGFAGASARVIARRAGCNQALVFYHFGTVTNLLLAALDETSRRRMERYGQAVGAVSTVAELVQVAGQIYREDLDAGHITVLSELISGASSVPGLGAEVSQRVIPWIDFSEAAVTRVLGVSLIGELLPARDLAYAIVALYLGVEMLSHLNGDRTSAESLFALGGRLSQILGPMAGSPPPSE
jgi:AcrR family transcriptional regulator